MTLAVTREAKGHIVDHRVRPKPNRASTRKGRSPKNPRLIPARVIRFDEEAKAPCNALWLETKPILPENTWVSRGYYLNERDQFAEVVVKEFVSPHLYALERDNLLVLNRARNHARFARMIHCGTLLRKDRDKPCHFITMEVAQGRSFLDVLNDLFPPLPAESVDPRVFSYDLLSTLGDLHGLEMIHMDLKPENLFLDRHQRITIIDFGASVYQKQFRDWIQFTFEHAPPEVIKAYRLLHSLSNFHDKHPRAKVEGRRRISQFQDFWDRCIGPWSDLYSAGILIRLLFAPLRKASIPIPAEVKTLVKALTQKDYEKRPQNAQEALRFLD